jgi:hypothetical protein
MTHEKGGGDRRGAKSYMIQGQEAWSSINHSVLTGTNYRSYCSGRLEMYGVRRMDSGLYICSAKGKQNVD